MPRSRGLLCYMESVRFGDINTRVHIVLECVIITTKVHKIIPYHTVNHWSEAFNPFLLILLSYF